MNTQMGADDEESDHSCNNGYTQSLEAKSAGIAISSRGDFALWMSADCDPNFSKDTFVSQYRYLK